LPLAELAAFRLSKSKLNLKIGLYSNLLEVSPTLIIPQGNISNIKTILTGKATISRFFARQSSALYNEEDLDVKLSIDSVIDAINLSPDNHQEIINSIKSFRGGQDLTLADVYAWDYAISNPTGLEDVVSKYEYNEIFMAVKKEILERVRSAPVMDVFKYEIVKEMNRITGVDSEKLYNSFGEPRILNFNRIGDKSEGNLCIAIPQLKLKGGEMNGKALSEKYKTSEKIFSTSPTGVFINFTFNNELFRKMILEQVIYTENEYGNNSNGLGNLAIVEYSSPNIAKPFHVGNI
jgi:arginyl-tRNA synthetase